MADCEDGLEQDEMTLVRGAVTFKPPDRLTSKFDSNAPAIDGVSARDKFPALLKLILSQLKFELIRASMI